MENESTIKKQLDDLITEIGTLPQDQQNKLDKIVQETREKQEKMKKAV